MGSLGTHTVRIANMSTPSKCSTVGFSQTACGFVLEFADIITGHVVNSNNTNSGGWPASEMREYVNDTIYNALPTTLKNAIINTSVVSGHGSGDSNNFTSTDKLYLLSSKEVWNGETGYDSADNASRQLDYYANNGTTLSNYSGAIKSKNDSAIYWWLRSAGSNVASNYFFVLSGGGWFSDSTRNTYGVSPAFRIG